MKMPLKYGTHTSRELVQLHIGNYIRGHFYRLFGVFVFFAVTPYPRW